MQYKLLKLFKDELYKEAERLVPICYDKDDLLFCSFEKVSKEIDNKYKNFETHIHLILPELCYLKSQNKNYKDITIDYENSISHHLKLIEWKIKIDKYDLRDITKMITEDIINNNYNTESLYTIIPKLAKKYIKGHHDSVDWECIVMLLENELKEKGYDLESTNMSELKKI